METDDAACAISLGWGIGGVVQVVDVVVFAVVVVLFSLTASIVNQSPIKCEAEESRDGV